MKTEKTELPFSKNPRLASPSQSQQREKAQRQRLSQALRENLRKRKEQMRARESSQDLEV